MSKHNRMIIAKQFLCKTLGGKEDLSDTLSRFIDNSLEAWEINTDKTAPCKVTIEISNNEIVVKDNSGGIANNLSGDDVFKFGNENEDELTGIGLKKSFFILGKSLSIFSNNKDYPRVFNVDLEGKGNELNYVTDENVKFNPKEDCGTFITISKLNKDIKKLVSNTAFVSSLKNELGRRYSKLISNKILMIKLVIGETIEFLVDPVLISYDCCKKGKLLDKYDVVLYKAKESEAAGIDFYVNDFMVYNRVKNISGMKWNKLSENKHSFKRCVVEIDYHGDEETFEKEKELVFKEVVDFIKENKNIFSSETVTIQFEADIGMVEELKLICGEDTAKGVGMKAFLWFYQNQIGKKK